MANIYYFLLIENQHALIVSFILSLVIIHLSNEVSFVCWLMELYRFVSQAGLY